MGGSRQSIFSNFLFSMNNLHKFTTLGICAAVLATTSSTFAAQGDPTLKGPHCSPERHTAMIEAFANNDYAAWKELMTDKGRVTTLINADNFPIFAKAHTLALEGNIEEAKALRAELGLGLKDGKGHGFGMKKGMKMGQWHDSLDEETKAQMELIRNLLSEGKIEEAQALKAEIGFPLNKRLGQMGGKQMFRKGIEGKE